MKPKKLEPFTLDDLQNLNGDKQLLREIHDIQRKSKELHRAAQRLGKWMFNDDGTFTAAFIEEITKSC